MNIKIISVEIQLPPKNKNVFCINSEHFLGVAYWDGDNWYEASSHKKTTKVRFWLDIDLLS